MMVSREQVRIASLCGAEMPLRSKGLVSYESSLNHRSHEFRTSDAIGTSSHPSKGSPKFRWPFTTVYYDDRQTIPSTILCSLCEEHKRSPFHPRQLLITSTLKGWRSVQIVKHLTGTEAGPFPIWYRQSRWNDGCCAPRSP